MFNEDQKRPKEELDLPKMMKVIAMMNPHIAHSEIAFLMGIDTDLGCENRAVLGHD
ncbi:hypothetical protein Ga0123461_1790 [Mariprofundus aestuarium]|uniref:Uncharacterized protein n=1 Tax=Mariprofundus aestuarium TaxID=1921086 RepID=A0A2K8KZ40_MARES|nr:hypothetical protein [Mariprofundus aestuarium]ATX80203.1 hypothetical protein Ga0123461_1790 [Mariprofundus aestuarium]